MITQIFTHDCPTCKRLELCSIDFATFYRAGFTGDKNFFCWSCQEIVPVAIIRTVEFPDLIDVPLDMEAIDYGEKNTVVGRQLNLVQDAAGNKRGREDLVVKAERNLVPGPKDSTFTKPGVGTSKTYLDFYPKWRNDPIRYLGNAIHKDAVSKILWWETAAVKGWPDGTTCVIDQRKSKVVGKPNKNAPNGATAMTYDLTTADPTLPRLYFQKDPRNPRLIPMLTAEASA